MSKRLTNIQRIGLLLTGILAAVVIILVELRAGSVGRRTDSGELRTDSVEEPDSTKDFKYLKGSPPEPTSRDFLGEEF